MAVLPPLGPTGVEAPRVSLSWLAGTVAGANDRALGLAYSGWFREFDRGGVIDGRGNIHYAGGHRAADSAWVVLWDGQGGARGTVYVEARQSLFERGVPSDMVGHLLATLRPSRIDLAADCFGPAVPRPATLYSYLGGARTRTHRASWVLTVNGEGGEKLTIGSRSSDRYLRVYLKGPEWVRHELELKGTVARSVASRFSAGDRLDGLFSLEYGRIVGWPA